MYWASRWDCTQRPPWGGGSQAPHPLLPCLLGPPAPVFPVVSWIVSTRTSAACPNSGQSPERTAPICLVVPGGQRELFCEDRERRRRPGEDGGREGSRRGTPRAASTPAAGRETRNSLSATGRNQPPRHLHFGNPASRTTQFVVICYGNPGKGT